MEVGTAGASALVNGTSTPSPAEDEELYTQLLRLRDVVTAGKHASFKLPASSIEQLKAALIVPDVQMLGSVHPQRSNSSAFTTNQTQLSQSSSFPTFSGLPGLQAPSAPFLNGTSQSYTKPTSAGGLDPIFLEKSDRLVRAEGRLKRQRLDRDLQAQVDQRKHSSSGKDPVAEAPSPIDIDLVLLNALERVKPISGLKTAGSAASSSFDENDYYSSQVQSDWSSEACSSKGSDKAAGAFTADFERLDGAPQASDPFTNRLHPAIPGSSYPQPSKDRPHVYTNEPEDVYESADEDDEYTPPDATAFDGCRDGGMTMEMHQVMLQEEDNSDYEPGEITQDSIVPTPRNQQPAQPSPHVPVIRNHLTHIVAPQPNRVSPLATAKGRSIELELVNGRPEVVQKPQQRSNHFHSRASTASPSGNGVSGSGKKNRRNKKRKRDQEPTGRAKRRRERQNAVDSPSYPVNPEPYIKDEPVSPPPFANVPEVPPYKQPTPRGRAEIDLLSPRHAPQRQTQYIQYANESPRSGLRYEYVQPSEPSVVTMASPSAYRPVQRDTQNLRRVASLHHAQRPASPPQRVYSPVAPYRTMSMTYGDPRFTQQAAQTDDNYVATYQEQPPQESVSYARAERSRSPPRSQQYRDPFAGRVSSPALMPPPSAAPPRRIIVDQYGNRYAADPEPAPAPAPRASVAPVETRPQPEAMYERAPSRMQVAYAQPPPSSSHYEELDTRMVPPSSSAQYEQLDARMAPPSKPTRRQPAPEQQVEFIDANGYRFREYSTRPVETPRYVEAPTSPVYQEVRGYEPMPPPPAPPQAREPTSPVYVPTRSYSVRPEEPQQVPSGYIRQPSLAPVHQYVRQEAPPPPARAVTAVPSSDYGAPVQPQRTYTHTAQANVRYVDQYGNAVFPREIRQVSEFRY